MTDADIRVAVEAMSMDIADIKNRCAPIGNLEKKVAEICATWSIWSTTKCADHDSIINENRRSIQEIKIDNTKIATRAAVLTGFVVALFNAAMLVVAVLQLKG